MPSSFRIRPAEMTGPYATALKAVSRRMWGDVPDLAYLLWHHKPLAKAVFGFERKVATWQALNPHLKAYATMATAAGVGCSWCIDFGYYLAHTGGLDTRKVSEVPRWRESDVFTSLEREVMAYAEDMTATPPTVSDEQVASLDAQLGHRAMVELTMTIAIENQRSRFNAAMGLSSQGFSDRCELRGA